jgi:hypothetical protein
LTETQNNKYRTEKTGDILIFKTAYFSAERGSVLHSGIYNRDFASALSSLCVAGLVYLVVVMNLKKGILPHVVFLVVFAAGFLFLRGFVFKERYMETVLDRAAGRAEIYMVGITKKKKDSVAIKDINNVLIERRKSAVENPDGVEFVQKISSQHGMAIPGFGEEKIFFLLKLKLSDGTDRLIFADGDMQGVIKAHNEIKAFLKI